MTQEEWELLANVQQAERANANSSHTATRLHGPRVAELTVAGDARRRTWLLRRLRTFGVVAIHGVDLDVRVRLTPAGRSLAGEAGDHVGAGQDQGGRSP